MFRRHYVHYGYSFDIFRRIGTKEGKPTLTDERQASIRINDMNVFVNSGKLSVIGHHSIHLN
jgi:hypothetical protein